MVDDARIVRLRLGDDRGELVTDIGAKPVLIAVLAASVACEAHHIVDRLHGRSLTEVDASIATARSRRCELLRSGERGAKPSRQGRIARHSHCARSLLEVNANYSHLQPYEVAPARPKVPCSPGGRATISLTNWLAGKLPLSLAGNPPMILDRRHLLRVGGAAAIAAGTPPHSQAQAPRDSGPQGTPPQPAGAAPVAVPDHTI